MSAAVGSSLTQRARTFRLYRTLPRLLRDPMREIVEIGRLSSGELVRIDFGVFRAYVASHPDHVQHILRANSVNFMRELVPKLIGAIQCFTKHCDCAL